MPKLPEVLDGSAAALLTIAPLLPSQASINEVVNQLSPAIARGYFTPEEDELIREKFSKYLTVRGALYSVLMDLKPIIFNQVKPDDAEYAKVFLIAFCTAAMLRRSGRHLIVNFRSNKMIRRKLNEAEPRYGIPRKQFTAIYRSLTSLRNVIIFRQGVNYFEDHRSQIMALEANPKLSPVVELLKLELPYIENNLDDDLKKRLQFRLHSAKRRGMGVVQKTSFSAFKISGRLISEIRNQWKRKRVTPVVQRKIQRFLQPGDVIITRHDDAATNLFLPGFWPHASLYIGSQKERAALDPDNTCPQLQRSQDPKCILEARKDGVLFRELSDTLNVDACTIIRPKLSKQQIRDGIARGMSHEGKEYDFEFDFTRADKLVCTEVVYRAFDGIGDIQLDLTNRSGRLCLSAEDLLDSAVDNQHFTVVAVYGAQGNRFFEKEKAIQKLTESYRKNNA
ncbi:MAG: YiiX/YebB-like N1pC/P60 family cysteine hydrolase [Mariniblastus sp.]